MLWPLILPMKITFWTFAAIVVLVTAIAPALKWKRKSTLGLTLLAAGVLFIPSSSGLMALLDTQRFGVFEYETYAEVQDFRVERYLPPAATSITVAKTMQGFRAQYSISETDLQAYLDDSWERFRNYYPHSAPDLRIHAISDRIVNAGSFDSQYGDLNWPPLKGAVEYHGPSAANGAGFTVWYSPSQQVAYERAGYW